MKKLSVLAWLVVLNLFLNCSPSEKNTPKTANNAQNDHQFSVLKEVPALPVINQNSSGTCWSFSTVSFLESEIIRIKGEYIDLSEMYPVRGTYLLKTWNYILRQGTARFTEGGLNHDPILSAREFGLVPLSVFSGLINGNTEHDHREMFEKLESTVREYSVPSNKKGTGWKTEIPTILDRYLGKLPQPFLYDGKEYTPQSFLDYTQLNLDDYLSITSFSHAPFFQPFILNIPANWANEKFYNLPLDEFMQNIDHALDAGFSLALDIDGTERNFSGETGIAVLHEQESAPNVSGGTGSRGTVNQEIRQVEFENFRTTDDHLMHIVGKLKDGDGNIFYKTKNSWGPTSGKEGFMYLSVPYMRMKAISVMLHRDGLTEETRNKLGL